MAKTPQEQIQEILDKNNLRLGYKFYSEIYKVLPAEVQLAQIILAKNGMKVAITFEPKEKKKK